MIDIHDRSNANPSIIVTMSSSLVSTIFIKVHSHSFTFCSISIITYLPFYLLIYLSNYQIIISLLIYLSIYLSIHLSIYLSIYHIPFSSIIYNRFNSGWRLITLIRRCQTRRLASLIWVRHSYDDNQRDTATSTTTSTTTTIAITVITTITSWTYRLYVHH